ncbi:MAG TPA: hypothetical protein V6C72_01525 [Chroococcales cyanobacterium]
MDAKAGLGSSASAGGCLVQPLLSQSFISRSAIASQVIGAKYQLRVGTSHPCWDFQCLHSQLLVRWFATPSHSNKQTADQSIKERARANNQSHGSAQNQEEGEE